MTKYTVTKRDGLWWVVDADGFEVSYVGHDFKYEAVAAAKQRKADDETMDDFNYVGSKHHY
jgi:hypothetical protein